MEMNVGLFYKLHDMGVRKGESGCYYTCTSRIKTSGVRLEWGTSTLSGIHQGGFLSLLKYTTFMDPLLRDLENSKLGCSVSGVPTNPVGYADDMATCSVSKTKLDQALVLVSNYSNRWNTTPRRAP